MGLAWPPQSKCTVVVVAAPHSALAYTLHWYTLCTGIHSALAYATQPCHSRPLPEVVAPVRPVFAHDAVCARFSRWWPLCPLCLRMMQCVRAPCAAQASHSKLLSQMAAAEADVADLELKVHPLMAGRQRAAFPTPLLSS